MSFFSKIFIKGNSFMDGNVDKIWLNHSEIEDIPSNK